MASSAAKAGLVFAALVAVPLGGVHLYAWRASSAILPYHAEAWRDAGFALSHAEPELHPFRFVSVLRNVEARASDGSVVRAAELTVPLLPWMSAAASDVEYASPGGGFRAARVSGQVRRGVANRLEASDIQGRDGHGAFFARSLSARQVDSRKKEVEGLSLAGLRYVSPTGSVEAASASARSWAWPEGAGGMRGVVAEDVQLQVRPERNSPLLARRGENALRAERVEFDSEGGPAMRSAARISVSGLRVDGRPGGVTANARIRRTETGRQLVADVTDAGMTRSVLEASWPAPAGSPLATPPSGVSDVRASLDLTDPSGHVRDYVRTLAAMNGAPRGGEDGFIPSLLQSRGVVARDGAATMATWLRNPARTLTLQLDNQGTGALRIAARIKN